MMDLKVTLIQSHLYWENVDQNLITFTEKINSIKEPTDIIVLPEMFNTGFSMDSEKLAERMSGKTVSWMMETAKKTNAVILGSLIITEHDEYYNRLVWANPMETITLTIKGICLEWLVNMNILVVGMNY